jgi:hypothetical protein
MLCCLAECDISIMTCIRPFAEMNYIFEAAIKAFVNFVLDIVRHKCPDILEKLGLLPTTQNIVKTTSNESVLNGTNSSAASNVDNEVRLSKESAVTVSEPPYFHCCHVLLRVLLHPILSTVLTMAKRQGWKHFLLAALALEAQLGGSLGHPNKIWSYWILDRLLPGIFYVILFTRGLHVLHQYQQSMYPVQPNHLKVRLVFLIANLY